MLNRLPIRAFKGKTPYEAWLGRKSSIKNLKIFGSIRYSFVPSIKSSKLDEKTIKEVFIGYFVDSKGYRIFYLNTQKVISSRDIIHHY